MKKIISNAALSVIVSLFMSCYAQQPEIVVAPGSPEMRGYIKIAGHADQMPQFRVLLSEGKETISDREGFFTFPIDDVNIGHYSLIITKRVQQNFDKKNTLKSVSVFPDNEYRFYSFKNGAWIEQEKALHETNFVIPNQSVVFLVNPEYVQEVKDWNIQLAPHIIKLPMIVLK